MLNRIGCSPNETGYGLQPNVGFTDHLWDVASKNEDRAVGEWGNPRQGPLNHGTEHKIMDDF